MNLAGGTLSIIAGGFKITDLATRCPLTKRPLLDNPTLMSAPSRNVCIPLKIMIGRETKEIFTEVGPFFTCFDDLANKATVPCGLNPPSHEHRGST